MSEEEQPHLKFRRLLNSARGESEFVIATVLDIRGFSSFAMTVESVQAAAYLKRIYAEIIDTYLPNPSFYKPTGDGLIVVSSCEIDPVTTGRELIRGLARLLDDFGKLSDGDPLINFDVPSLLGIGVSRGAATRLVSNGLKLDYSGRPLNMASRLVDFARPSGIVFDAAYGMELVPDELKGLFQPVEVFVKGISGSSLTKVFYTAGRTNINPSATIVPTAKWRNLRYTKKLSEWKLLQPAVFDPDLEATPGRKEDIIVKASFETPADIVTKTISETTLKDFEYSTRPNPNVHINLAPVIARAAAKGLPDESDLTIEVVYLES